MHGKIDSKASLALISRYHRYYLRIGYSLIFFIDNCSNSKWSVKNFISTNCLRNLLFIGHLLIWLFFFLNKIKFWVQVDHWFTGSIPFLLLKSEKVLGEKWTKLEVNFDFRFNSLLCCWRVRKARIVENGLWDLGWLLT